MQPSVKGSWSPLGRTLPHHPAPGGCGLGEGGGISSENEVGKDFQEEKVRDLGRPASNCLFPPWGSGPLGREGVWECCVAHFPPPPRGVESPGEGWQEAGRFRKRWRLSGRRGGGRSEPHEIETDLPATRGARETHRRTGPLGGPGPRTQRPRLGGAEQGAGPCPSGPPLPGASRGAGGSTRRGGRARPAAASSLRRRESVTAPGPRVPGPRVPAWSPRSEQVSEAAGTSPPAAPSPGVDQSFPISQKGTPRPRAGCAPGAYFRGRFS